MIVKGGIDMYMFKTYERKEYKVIINYHTQRSNLYMIYKVIANTETEAKLIALGTLLLEEVRRYIKVDSVIVEGGLI